MNATRLLTYDEKLKAIQAAKTRDDFENVITKAQLTKDDKWWVEKIEYWIIEPVLNLYKINRILSKETHDDLQQRWKEIKQEVGL